MADYGVTSKGFLTKRFQDLLEENRAYAESVFADLLEDGEVLDTSDSSIVGRLVRLVAPSSAELWEVARDVYSSLDPEKATGASLDVIAQYSGITRRGKSRSSTTLLLGAEDTTVIPAGSVIRDNKYKTEWYTLRGVEIGEGNVAGVAITPTTLDVGTVYTLTMDTLYTSNTYTVEVVTPNSTFNDVLDLLKGELNTSIIESEIVDGVLKVTPKDLYSSPVFTLTNLNTEYLYALVNVQSVDYGAISSSVGRVSDIATPVLGWINSTNPFTNILGRLEESDDELRTRLRDNKNTGSVGFARSIKDSLLAVLGVKEVNLYENTYDYVDSNGLPPHSFKVVINGGNPTNIAEMIFKNRPLGIGSFGSVTAEYVDDSGQIQEEQFSRPNFKEIYMDISLTPDGDWNNKSTAQLKQAIVDYFENNMAIGKKVSYSRLFIPINSIPNQTVSDMKIGLSPSTTAYQDIDMAFDDLAVIGANNINVTIV